MDAVSVKVAAASLLASFNTLQIEYEQWLKYQQTSFIETVKRAQLADTALVPQQLRCLHDFTNLCQMARRCQRLPGSSAAWRMVDVSKLDQYLVHWHRLGTLNSDLMKLTEAVLMLSSRQTDDSTDDNYRKMEEVRTLNTRVIHYLSAQTLFSHVSQLSSEACNTPRYRLLTSDTYLGDFITFIPLLVQLCSKICMLIRQL